ncbi:hypothetical protein MAPG_01567 [Magnaporthiopsis poae ATCC 64411]|uniref:Uncharacterized protein n=1 Tax=Magnaporthiopsis poae (strain ATCC 64411 / 73-15) TaxID=644358 RepID=A0A0C4DP17_MAGP6|nr:hypothetical protein MAPG_01567 [Magnaporthiopsis poae ATCC 64411]
MSRSNPSHGRVRILALLALPHPPPNRPHHHHLEARTAWHTPVLNSYSWPLYASKKPATYLGRFSVRRSNQLQSLSHGQPGRCYEILRQNDHSGAARQHRIYQPAIVKLIGVPIPFFFLHFLPVFTYIPNILFP